MNDIHRKVTHALNYLFHNRAQLCDSMVRTLGGWLPDKLYLSLRFRCRMGYWPNFKEPRTFNEKINWLKLYNRKPEYTKMVDKYAVKDYVAAKIGNEYIIPTIGVWETPELIDWDRLPNQFVLKTTHGGGGGGVVICRNKQLFDREEAIRKLSASLKNDIYCSFREWPYKNVRKQIIAEKYVEPPFSMELKDYKFFCFNGKVRCFKIDIGRFTEHHANYYSPKGKLLFFGEVSCSPQYNNEEILPPNLSEMISLAEKLSEGIPFIRVDFYNVERRIYFGELTFFPAAGMGKFTDDNWDIKLGNLLKLPKG